MLAQTVLSELRDVMPVDCDAAMVDVIKPQQQIYDCGFAGTRGTNDANLFSGRYFKIQIADNRGGFVAVTEGNIFEVNVASNFIQRSCASPIRQLQGAGNQFHTVLGNADIAEQGIKRTHQPAEHQIEAQDQSECKCHGPGCCLSFHP